MRNKWIYTIVVLALSFFASCSDHLEDSGTGGKSRKVVFRLSVSDTHVGSRVAWSESYNSSDVEGIENYINPNTLQVVVYEGTTFIGKATDVLSWPGAGDTEYQFVGDVSHLKLSTNKSYQFMVLANSMDVSRATQLSRLPYDISELNSGIPMWGGIKHTPTDSEFQDLETIDMLRAAVKVEVALDITKMNDYTLQEVTIKPYNTRGYCAPLGVNSAVEKTTDLDQEGCYNPHSSLAVSATGHVSLPFAVIDGGKRAIVYVPEYDNKHTSSHAATINVTLGKDSKTYFYEDAIVFYEYENGSPSSSPEKEYNIIRNHHYKFTVTGVSGGLLIKYAVNDWVYDESTHKTTLGTYGYPTYHNPLESVAEVNSPKFTPVLWPEENSGDFWGYFYFEQPIERMWTPTFKNASRTDYKIEVWNKENTEKLYDSNGQNNTWDDRDNYSGWYLIKVKANINDQPTSGVSLGITSSIGDNSSPYYLLINGTERSDIRWMNSGSDPRFIDIKLINNQAVSFNMDDDGNLSNTFTTASPIMKKVKVGEVFADDQAFTACFQLTNPGEYHYWYPTLNGSKLLDGYAVRVYNDDNLIYSTYEKDGKNSFDCLKQLVPVGNSDWYTIKVFPVCETPNGSAPIKLGVNYERGNNQPKALDINKKGVSETKWSNSGSDTKYIEIIHGNN